MVGTTIIYGLVSTSDLTNVRYIGKTVQRLSKRLHDHLREKTNGNTYKINWIKQQLDLGYDIKAIVIDEVWEKDWEFWEKFWIWEYYRRGYKLTNLAPGGVSSNNEISVVALTLDGKFLKRFSSYGEASRYYNISEREVALVANPNFPGKLSSDNKIFIREDDYDSEKVYCVIKGTRRGKEVYQYDLDGNFIKKWNKIKEAQKFYNLSKTSIPAVLAGTQKSSGGYRWSKTFQEKLPKIDTFKYISGSICPINIRRLCIYKDNILVDKLDRVQEACNKHILASKKIYDVLNKKAKSHKGYTFEWEYLE